MAIVYIIGYAIGLILAFAAGGWMQHRADKGRITDLKEDRNAQRDRADNLAVALADADSALFAWVADEKRRDAADARLQAAYAAKERECIHWRTSYEGAQTVVDRQIESADRSPIRGEVITGDVVHDGPGEVHSPVSDQLGDEPSIDPALLTLGWEKPLGPVGAARFIHGAGVRS